MLRQVLRERGITVVAAAKAAGMRRDTLHKKISRKQPFFLWEAMALHKTCFPDLDFLEVFAAYADKLE